MSLGPEITNSMAGLEIIKSAFDMRTAAARDTALYWLALVLLVATLAAIYLLLRSRQGLALAAIRDSEPAAESVGVDSVRTKLLVYVLAAFGTGMVGALIYLQKARISPDAAFSVLDWTAYVIFIVIIGGIGTIEGPIIGAIVLYILQDQLAALGPWYLMALGALAVIVMLVAPKGLWGVISERLDIQLFPLRRQFRQ
jgi:branched-chain amino acid transport system permease protein